MKNIFSKALLMTGLIAGFTSCDKDMDSNPTLQKPTSFVLNASELADQYIKFQEGDKSSINLTWSQPDYGFPIVATYKIQIGLVEDGAIRWSEEDGKPKYIDTEFTSCNVNLSGELISTAINQLDGVEGEDDFVDKGFREVAMRVASYIKSGTNEVEGSRIISNVITFKHISEYCAVKKESCIWLIGNISGWKEPSEGNKEDLEEYKLVETNTGSKIFRGTFEAPAGTVQFRFYTKLTGWDGGASIGLIAADESTVVEFKDGAYESSFVAPGKGSWQFNDFPGGNIEMTVDMNKKKVSFKITEGEIPTGFIYLIGACGGWTEPAASNADDLEDWKLFSYASTGEGVYTNTFEIEKDQFQFRFYSELTGWDGGASIGSQVDDAALDISLTDGVFNGDVAIPGKGSWKNTDWAGGKLKITVDTKSKKVSFEEVQ